MARTRIPSYRYYESSFWIIQAGVIGGLIGSMWGWMPAFIGFLAMAVPAFGIAVAWHVQHDRDG